MVSTLTRHADRLTTIREQWVGSATLNRLHTQFRFVHVGMIGDSEHVNAVEELEVFVHVILDVVGLLDKRNVTLPPLHVE